MDLPLFLALVALGLGAMLQGSVGFGMNVLAAPILAVIDPRFVPGPLLVAAGVMTALVLVRERAALSVRQVGWAFAGRIPGSVLGALAVAAMSVRTLSITLAVIVLAAVAVSAVGVTVPITRRSLVIAGGLSGFTGTSTSVGGPPMALLYQRQEGAGIRADLSGFFLLGVMLSITLLALTGAFGADELRLGALTIPPVVLGFIASRWTRERVSGPRVRPAVLALAGLSAFGLLVRTLVV